MEKKELNIQLEQNKETRIQKNEGRLRNPRGNIQTIGVPEGEKEEKEIENIFEKMMKEKLLNLAKEIDFQEVQEA